MFRPRLFMLFGRVPPVEILDGGEHGEQELAIKNGCVPHATNEGQILMMYKETHYGLRRSSRTVLQKQSDMKR